MFKLALIKGQQTFYLNLLSNEILENTCTPAHLPVRQQFKTWPLKSSYSP
jgi:hypothetical protein